jgi:hypothetical protein
MLVELSFKTSSGSNSQIRFANLLCDLDVAELDVAEHDLAGELGMLCEGNAVDVCIYCWIMKMDQGLTVANGQ